MSNPLTIPPRKEFYSFFDAPVVTDFDNLDADIAILGLPFGDPYSMEETINDQTNAPTAIRRAWQRALRGLERYDFELGGPLLDNQPIKIIDCGDIPGNPRNMLAHYQLAEQAVKKLLDANILPIILGGDHGIPIPVFRALKDKGPITLIHIDSHLDWRDEVNGVQEGYSSPIRRAAEMDHIDQIYQIGLRSAGSARPQEVEDAIAYGAHLIPDIELQRIGMDAVLEMIPAGGNYYITIDADGMDPTIMPAVNGPAPGGVTYPQIRTLIQGLVKKGRVVGMDIVEITPAKDLNNISSITAGRIICNLIGMAVRAGYFKK
ncbi:agmatinase [Edaphovirga cremea]|uniref:agmatinase n=1 Tax=Edaphovirga cremea TaxID=2267246 RepID=UPI000DEF7C08|nr:agmatinase [Edaphovirga cremea]